MPPKQKRSLPSRSLPSLLNERSRGVRSQNFATFGTINTHTNTLNNQGVTTLVSNIRRSPLKWHELAELSIRPDFFNLGNNSNNERKDETFGPLGCVALASVLHLLPNLSSLDLRDNAVGNAGATAVADALASVPKLGKLSLARNQVGDSGAIALALALPSAPSLHYLRIGHNFIGQVGVDALRRAALARHRAVRDIQITGLGSQHPP